MNALISFLVIAVTLTAIPVPSQAQVRPGPTTAKYTLGPDDVIELTVYGRPELTGEVVVDYQGIVQVALVGEVHVAGRTPDELGELLVQRYQLLDPGITEVLVSVVEYKSRTITVVGEVRSPGPYGFVQIPDLWDVILTAGGPTAEADLSRVQIVRGSLETPQEPRSLTVDLSAGVWGARPSEPLVLRATDKIFIPSLEDVAAGGQVFQVLGAVGSPGIYRIGQAQNIVQALAASGGPLPEADLSEVFLTRSSSVGTQAWKLNLEDYLFEGKAAPNLEILAGDTVTVPRRSGFVESFRTFSSLILPFLSLAVTYVLVANN